MSATTVNAFPPLHAFNSSRSWFLALIVLVHLGFFWALTSGLTVYVWPPAPPGDVFLVPSDPPKPPDNVIIDVRPDFGKPWVPVIDRPTLPEEVKPEGPIVIDEGPRPPAPPFVTEAPGSGPVIVVPRSDPRYPFTEPEYPVSEIRQGHEGTVVLRVQILPNGRVGAVQVERSSGFVKLDESAAREARRWRMKPGTQDGAASAMWTLVPVTFQLKN
jgi:protein TonB